MNDRIGVVGLGRMGSAIAERLARQGQQVGGWTRSGVSRLWADPLGIKAHDDLGALVAHSDIILLSLFDDAAVLDVLAQILASNPDGRLIADTSTVSTDLLAGKIEEIVKCGATAVDAPISGGPELVLAGTCGIFVGGTAQNFDRLTPTLEKLSNRITHVGPLGTGLAMKVINNGLLQGAWATLVDVVQIAKRSGISLEKTLDILSNGPAVSPMMRARIPKMLGEDLSVGFDIHGAVKDAEVFVSAAHRLGLEAPTLSVARDAWNRSLEAEQGECDVAALISLAYNEA